MLLRIVIALLGGAVLAGAFEPVGVAVLMPVALALLVWCVRDLPLRWAWLPSVAFGTTFASLAMFWMRAIGTDAWLAISAVEAAFFVPLGLAWSWSLRHAMWPLWTALWWVVIENWRAGWPFSGMPFGRLAYATVDTPWAAALPWVGMTGVSVLVALTGTSLAWLMLAGRTRPRVAIVLVASLAAVTFVPLLLIRDVRSNEQLTVAVVQGNVPGSGTDVASVHRDVTANHVAATVDLGARIASGEVERPGLVVWPENSTAVDPFRDREVRNGIETAVAAVDTPVLVGAMADDPQDDGQVLNQGIVWHPETGGGDRYTKRHPVPYGEYIPFRGSFIPDTYGRLREIGRDMARGTRLGPLVVGDVRVADAICFDVAYDDGIAAQVVRGGQFLTVQTSNAMFIDTGQIAQQFEISRLRALEHRRWVVVAAINGISGVVDPQGRVVAYADAREPAVLVEEIDLVDEVTPASRMGPWPRHVIVALVALHALFTALAYRGRKARRVFESPQPEGDS